MRIICWCDIRRMVTGNLLVLLFASSAKKEVGMSHRKRYVTTERIQQMDPQRDAIAICHLLVGYEFPWDITRALETALLRTFCVPAILQLLDNTGEFHRHTQKHSVGGRWASLKGMPCTPFGERWEIGWGQQRFWFPMKRLRLTTKTMRILTLFVRMLIGGWLRPLGECCYLGFRHGCDRLWTEPFRLCTALRTVWTYRYGNEARR